MVINFPPSRHIRKPILSMMYRLTSLYRTMSDILCRSAYSSTRMSPQATCHGDVCHFSASVLDTFLQGCFPVFHATEILRVRRYPVDIMNYLCETLTPGSCALVNSQTVDPISRTTTALLRHVLRCLERVPFVFCRTSNSCSFFHPTSFLLPWNAWGALVRNRLVVDLVVQPLEVRDFF